jgi:hypothetical protein
MFAFLDPNGLIEIPIELSRPGSSSASAWGARHGPKAVHRKSESNSRRDAVDLFAGSRESDSCRMTNDQLCSIDGFLSFQSLSPS